jgi:tetratricopeptide (TPR) repeat protein
MRETTRRFFFRHLRDGRSLRNNPLTWLIVGADAEFLPKALLVRAVHDGLSHLVDEICRRPPFLSKPERARRLREIFNRHIVGSEHWSSLASELFLSRRQFFRDRKLLCDELCSLLEAGSQSRPGRILVQPSSEDLVFNEASLALQTGNPDSAERIVETLSTPQLSAELRSRALTLAADCASDRLRFDTALSRCALAANAAAEITDFENRAVALAHVNVTRSRGFLLRSDYHRARLEIDMASRVLSELSPASDDRRSDLMQAILVRKAELAIHVGDFNSALEQVNRLKYAFSRNGQASEAAFDLASIESAVEMFSGRFEGALATLTEAFLSAQRLGFNRQIVRLAIERAWVEIMVDRNRGPMLAPQIASLSEAVRVPALELEASLFCAANQSPVAALEYGSKAHAIAPHDSMWAARATLAKAVSSLKLGRVADAWGLATEAERLTDRLGNHRTHACSLALMAKVKFKCGDMKLARTLQGNATELLRLYAAVPERSKFEELA